MADRLGWVKKIEREIDLYIKIIKIKWAIRKSNCRLTKWLTIRYKNI